ncbi:hypothetical protein HPULCUR_000087 [Helicostylum pulchrum]|uniref:Uncharacterized protein n=1 Tax=Helicostylum pulchrum TaxID=562976 RepID=A0ABP9XIZ2_9FUNG
MKTTIEEEDETPKIYILESPSPGSTFKEECLLQNYSRSARFTIKGSVTLNPLYTNITFLEHADSLILRCLAYNTFTTEDKAQLLDHIYAASVTYSLDIRRGADDIAFLELLQQMRNTKFNIVGRAVIVLIEGLNDSHSPQTVMEGALATSVYKVVVGYRCNVIHMQKV